MRNLLRTLSAAVLAATLVWWISAGAHTGWSKTSVANMMTDEITGIDYPVWEKRFVPGVDFLAAGATISALLLGTSFLTILNPSKRP
jgi:hypothetical protein